MVTDVQDVIATALGAEAVTTTVEGRERYTVTSAIRETFAAIRRRSPPRCSFRSPSAARVPLGEVAKIELARGRPPSAPKTPSLPPTSMSTLRDRDLGGYVAERRRPLAEQVAFPPGDYVTWSGQFEYMERAKARLKIVVPVTVLIIFLLLYLNFRRVTETLIVMLSVPFALAGGMWLMWWLGFNFSVAVAVGFIALAGVAAETGVVMLIYLDNAHDRAAAERAEAGENARRTICMPQSCPARSSACGRR